MAELKWKKVFCPVDFSEESRAALRVAVDLARRFDAELGLFHADVPGSVLKAAASLEGQLADWKAQAESMGAPRVRTMSAMNEPPGMAIVENAKRNGFDLIVMGTHGRTGRHHAILGSTAEEVVRQSRVPVLTVHADWP